MHVYLHGSSDRPPPPFHVKFVCPAGHLVGQEVPTHWVDAENKPVTFKLDFIHGTAEVPDDLGKYLIATKQAHKTRLVRPGVF